MSESAAWLWQLAKAGVVLVAKGAIAHPGVAVCVIGVVVVAGVTFYIYQRKNGGGGSASSSATNAASANSASGNHQTVHVNAGADTAALQAALDKANKENEALQVKLNASEKERKELQEQLDARNKKVAELEDKVKSLEKQMKTMNDNNATMMNDYAECRKVADKFEKYMLQHSGQSAQSA